MTHFRKMQLIHNPQRYAVRDLNRVCKYSPVSLQSGEEQKKTLHFTNFMLWKPQLHPLPPTMGREGYPTPENIFWPLRITLVSEATVVIIKHTQK